MSAIAEAGAPNTLPERLAELAADRKHLAEAVEAAQRQWPEPGADGTRGGRR